MISIIEMVPAVRMETDIEAMAIHPCTAIIETIVVAMARLVYAITLSERASSVATE